MARNRAPAIEAIFDLLETEGGWWTIKALTTRIGRPGETLRRAIIREGRQARLVGRTRWQSTHREKEYRLREGGRHG